MSYEILYNRQFLKTQDGKIIPIVLQGESNVYVCTWKGRERRERHWTICNAPYWCNYKIDFTPEELLKEQERWLDAKELYYYNGKFINGQQWYNIVKKSIEQAKTIEELEEYERPIAYLEVWKDGKCNRECIARLNSTKDLQNFIEIYNNRINDRAENERVYAIIDFNVEKFKHQRRNRHSKPQKELKQYYVVKFKNRNTEGYIYKLTARHIRYGCSPYGAKQFETEKQALKWIKDRNIEGRFNAECWVEKVG